MKNYNIFKESYIVAQENMYNTLSDVTVMDNDLKPSMIKFESHIRLPIKCP